MHTRWGGDGEEDQALGVVGACGVGVVEDGGEDLVLELVGTLAGCSL